MNPCWLFLIIPLTSVATLAADYVLRGWLAADADRVVDHKLSPSSRTMLCEMTRDLGRLNDTCRVEH